MITTPGEGEEAQQHDGRELVVEGDLREEAVDLEEERAVGSGAFPQSWSTGLV